MKVLLKGDTQVKDHLAMTSYLEGVLGASLSHFGEHVSRVDAHLSDDNSPAKANVDNIHCTLEAQLVGMAPVIAKDRAATSHQAIQGAADKLERALTHAKGKREAHRAKMGVADVLPELPIAARSDESE